MAEVYADCAWVFVQKCSVMHRPPTYEASTREIHALNKPERRPDPATSLRKPGRSPQEMLPRPQELDTSPLKQIWILYHWPYLLLAVQVARSALSTHSKSAPLKDPPQDKVPACDRGHFRLLAWSSYQSGAVSVNLWVCVFNFGAPL